MLIPIEERRTVRLTRLANAFLEALDLSDVPLATDYQLFLVFRELYKNPVGLYLRNPLPTVADYRRARNLLISAKKIIRDSDYAGAYRILSKQDLAADDAVCLVDSFCYISHLSAMQRWGLTDRRPDALHLTIPALKIIKPMLQQKMEHDYRGRMPSLSNDEIYRLNIVHHPNVVRKRSIDLLSTVHYGASIEIQGARARISTIGQTFLDMLEAPERCGGMGHVLDIWQEHAKSYLEEIIVAIDRAPKDIHKVRAGYILEETLKIDRPEITKWLSMAQRGGSRVLDSSKPFVNKFSEKWMISINA